MAVLQLHLHPPPHPPPPCSRLQLGHGAGDGADLQGPSSRRHVPRASCPAGTVPPPAVLAAAAVRQVTPPPRAFVSLSPGDAHSCSPAFPLRFSLTVWTSTEDQFSLQDLRSYRSRLDVGKIYFDLPDSVRAELRGTSAESE